MSDVIDLRQERRRRRPLPNEAKLMFAATTLWELRDDNQGLLFLDAAEVMDRIGPAFEAVMEVLLDITEVRRSS